MFIEIKYHRRWRDKLLCRWYAFRRDIVRAARHAPFTDRVFVEDPRPGEVTLYKPRQGHRVKSVRVVDG